MEWAISHLKHQRHRPNIFSKKVLFLKTRKRKEFFKNCLILYVKMAEPLIIFKSVPKGTGSGHICLDPTATMRRIAENPDIKQPLMQFQSNRSLMKFKLIYHVYYSIS